MNRELNRLLEDIRRELGEALSWATKADVAQLRKDIRKLVGDRSVSVKRINRKYADITRYEPFSPEEAAKIAKHLKANGRINQQWPERLDTIIAKPHHTSSFSSLIRVE